MDYLDFDLEVGAGSGHSYPVAVIRSPAGEAHSTMILPFDEPTLNKYLEHVQNALVGSGTVRRQAAQAVEEFGKKLSEALFIGDIRSCYDVSLREAAHQEKGLRVKLRVQAPDLAALPWEFLYDPRQGESKPHQPKPAASAVKRGTLICTYRGHDDWVMKLTWSPDGKHIASGSQDGLIHVWSPTLGQSATIYREHQTMFLDLAWSADSKHIASVGDEVVYVWDAKTGKTIYTYRGHQDTVRAVGWSPDGTRIASGSHDTTIHVFSISSGGAS